jgi:hypothetical protein
MRKLLLLAAVGGLATLQAGAAPISAVGPQRDALREAIPGVQLAWWRAGGVTPGGTRWHAGGTAGAYHYGAYHPPTYYHGYGGVHYGDYYHRPVAVTPWVHPAGTFAAGALVGGAIGAAAASSSAAATAAASAQKASQPPTVVNNYFYN